MKSPFASFLGSFAATALVLPLLPFLQQSTTRTPMLTPRDRAVLDMLDVTTLPGDGSAMLVCRTNFQIDPGQINAATPRSWGNLIVGPAPASVVDSRGNVLVCQTSTYLESVSCSVLASWGGTTDLQYLDGVTLLGLWGPGPPPSILEDHGVYISDFSGEVYIQGAPY